MIRIEHSVVVNRPLPEVWTFLSDPANNPQWQTGVVESETVGEGPIEAGTQVRVVRRLLGKRVETLFDTTEFLPNSHFAFQSVSGPVDLEGVVSVEEVDGGARVKFDGSGDPGVFLRMSGTIARWFARRQVEADYDSLKKVLEQS